MERMITYVIAVLMTAACGIHEIGESVRDPDGGIWTGPGMNAGQSDPDKTVCYVTAMDYPDGYDWRADREKGTVKCSLVVFADGVPMMKIPVGDAYQTSSDADMHRIIDGHIYTDYSTASETVIKKDGQEIIRYPGREMICGMLVEQGQVYTIGHPRSGEGFTYRRDGETLLEKSSGRTFSRLYRDNDSICFAYCEHIRAADGPVERYYSVVNGRPSQAALREDVRKVWDVVSCDGQVCYVASVIGVQSPVLVYGEMMSVLETPQGMNVVTARISSSEKTLCVEGLLASHGLPLASILWTGNSPLHIFNNGMTISSWCLQGDGVFCVLNPDYPFAKGKIYRCGEAFELPLGYVSMSGNSTAVIDGILHAGLSSVSLERPVIWKDGILDTLNVNGFITSVSSGRRRD